MKNASDQDKGSAVDPDDRQTMTIKRPAERPKMTVSITNVPLPIYLYPINLIIMYVQVFP